MNIKSYLRGAGVGLIVAALVMGLATAPKKEKVDTVEKETLIQTVSSTDTSVSVSVSAENTEKEPSKDDEKVNSDENQNTGDQTTGESGDDESIKTPEETPSENGEAGEVTTDVSEGENISSTEKTPTPIDPLEKGDTGFTTGDESVQIKIVKGDSSVSVARRMYNAGLVDSAVAFDKYLCKNGYDKSISVGTYTIKFGQDYETLAKIISKKKK